MKYIIVPPIKFIFACLVTIFMVFATIGTAIIFTIWEFKFNKGIGFDPVELCWSDGGHVSPYAKTPSLHAPPKYYDTFFHFLWNINPQ